MKKGIGFSAILLIFIIIFGLVPISVFAVGQTDDAPILVSSTKKSWESVKAALESKNFVPALYLDFEDQELGLVSKTEKNSQGNIQYLTSINSPYISGKDIQLKNYRQSYSIIMDDVNKALYLGNAENEDDNNDNYIDIMNNGVARGNDIFISVDLKMNGNHIASCNSSESLFCFINRDSGARFNTTTVWISKVGGLYTQNNFSPENLIGYLSDIEYTTVSLHVKLSENKYYVYLNDVLVTPDGEQFLSLNDDQTFGETGRSYLDYAFGQIRLYNSSDNISDVRNSGMFIDNIILAGRAQRNAHNTEEEDLFITDFSDAEAGKSLVANENIAGIAADGVTLTVNTAMPDGGILTYAKDGNDTVLKYGKPAGFVTPADAQAYFSVFGLYNIIGKNYSVSVDFKMGSETLGSTYQIMNPINRLSGSTPLGSVYLYADGNMAYNGVNIGKASTESYTNVTVDFVCNEASNAVKVHVYVNGELKTTASTTQAPWGENTPEKFFLNDIAFFCGYKNSIQPMNETELFIKDISVRLTDAYNSGENMDSPFINRITGFVKTAKILRYFNEDGTFKTENFSLDGENYIVGYRGNVIGKASDGIEMSYAPYFESVFNYGDTQNIELLKSEDASCINEIVTGVERAAYNYKVTVDDSSARYYLSYINTGTNQDSYWDYDLPSQYVNGASIGFEIDIMLDQYFSGAGAGANGLISVKGYNQEMSRPTLENDTIIASITEDGWLKSGNRKLVPLSKTEFTKISVILNTPTSGKADGIFDMYVNGVKILEDIEISSGCYGVQGFRSLQAEGFIAGMYIKNISIYADADKPMRFMTMEGGMPVLTDDGTKTPAKASDIKRGLIIESGAYRYYDEYGLPIVSDTVIIDGKNYTADANGKIVCNGSNHLGNIENGICSVCGESADGISTLYGNSLILGSDVKVVFYLSINPEVIEPDLFAEIGREPDFTEGRTLKISVSELNSVVIKGSVYYKISYGVPAKDIADTIKLRLFKNGEPIGTEYSYSAQTYIDEVKAEPVSITYSEELRALLSALELYGKLAKKDLDKTSTAVDVSALAGIDANSFISEGVTGAEANVTDSNKTDATAENPNGLIIRTKYSLSLESNIKMIFTFKSEVGSIYDYTFMIDGEEVIPKLRPEGNGLYYIEKSVNAYGLKEKHTLTVENSSGQNMLTITSSVLGFAYNNLSKSDDETHRNLMKSIFNYWKNADVYYKVANTEDNMINGADGEGSVLIGKTVYSFGDSLVQGHYSGLGMIDGLVSQYGMVHTKYAKGGNTITVNNVKTNVYSQVNAASAVCPDFVVFNGLTNDANATGFNNCTLGEITDGFNDEYDLTTFCGSFEATVKLMKEKYPTAKIIFVTPHNMPTRHAQTLELLVNSAIAVCEKWGIPVVDIYHDGAIDTNNDEQRIIYSYNSTEEEGNGNGTHLTSTGYNKFYAPLISAKMVELIKE